MEELERRIKVLEEENTALKDENDTLKIKVFQLDAQVKELEAREAQEIVAERVSSKKRSKAKSESMSKKQARLKDMKLGDSHATLLAKSADYPGSAKPLNDGAATMRRSSNVKDTRTNGQKSHHEKRMSMAIQSAQPDDPAQWSRSELLEYLEHHQLQFLKPLYDPNNPIFNTLATEETRMFARSDREPSFVYLQAATLTKLLDLLVLPLDAPLRTVWGSKDFHEEFVFNFQAFTTADVILNFFQSQVTQSGDQSGESDQLAFKQKIFIMKQFVAKFIGCLGADIKKQPELEKPLKQFIKFLKSQSATQEIGALLDENLDEMTSDDKIVNAPPVQYPEGSLSLLHIPTLEMARQLTLMDEEHISHIVVKDLLNKQWERATGAEGLKKFMAHSTWASNWVSTEILSRIRNEERSAAIIYFIGVAKHLYELKNFHGLMNLLSALQSVPISKLTKSWQAVSKKDKDELDQLLDFMSVEGNYSKYRAHLAAVESHTPCIPLYSVVLHNLFMNEERFETYVDEKKTQINWVKAIRNTSELSHLRQFTSKYQLNSEGSVAEWLKVRPVWNATEARYQISRLLDGASDLTDNPKIVFFKDIIGEGDPVLSEPEVQLLIPGAQQKHLKAFSPFLDFNTTLTSLAVVDEGEIVENHLLHTTPPSVGPRYVYGPSSLLGLSLLLNTNIPTTYSLSVGSENAIVLTLDAIAVKRACDHDEVLFAKIARSLAFRLSRRWLDLAGLATSSAPLMNLRRSQNKSHRALDSLRKHFNLEDEVVIKDFKCGIKTNMGNVSGDLFISPNFICFVGKQLGMVKKEKIHLLDIKSVTQKEKYIRIEWIDMASAKMDSCIFQAFEDINAACKFIQTFWKRVQFGGIIESTSPRTTAKDSARSWNLDDDEWELINKGGKIKAFKAGEALPFKDIDGQRFYKLVEGKTELFRENTDGSKTSLGTAAAPTFIGEYTMLFKRHVVLTHCVALEDTRVQILDLDYLEVLFAHKRHLEGKFYFVLGASIEQKLVAMWTSEGVGKLASIPENQLLPEPPASPSSTDTIAPPRLSILKLGKKDKGKEKKDKGKVDKEKQMEAGSDSEVEYAIPPRESESPNVEPVPVAHS